MIRERFVITSELNGTELLRSLAAHGRDSFGLRIVTPVETARLALARSGVGMTDQLITANDATALVTSAFRENGYFNGTSFADVSAVAASLNRLRICIPQDEADTVYKVLKSGKFRNKNAALLKIYEEYSALLTEKRLMDGICLMRRAIEAARPISAEFFTLGETPLMPLEEKLVWVVSGGKYARIGLPELFGKEHGLPKIAKITNAYGASNEAEHILNDILDGGAPLDACVVAAADTASYSQIFLCLAERFGIPVTFGCGVPVMNANPGKLLSLLSAWNGSGYNGKEALAALLFSDAFDRGKLKGLLGDEIDLKQLVDTAGCLRLSMNRSENSEKLDRYRRFHGAALSDAAAALADELEKGYAYLIEKYSFIRRSGTLQDKIDRSAVKVLSEALRSFSDFGSEEDLPKLIPYLLQKNRLLGKQPRGIPARHLHRRSAQRSA